MKPFFPAIVVAATVLGYVAGSVSSSHGAVSAQAGAQATIPTPTTPNTPSLQRDNSLWLDQPAKAQRWSAEDLKKIHGDRVAAAAADTRPPQVPGYRARTHTISVLTRYYHDKPIPSHYIKMMSQWDDAEWHEGISDIYVVTGGSGKLIAGGEIQNRKYRPAGGDGTFLLPGEFVGQPVVGGDTYLLRPGDIVAIPPNTAHWVQPDPGGVTYVLMKVNVGLYPWGISR